MQQQNSTPAAPPSEDSTAQALEEYLAAAEAGTAPPREQFLARYPELAEDLDGCLAALDFIGRAAEGPRSVVAEVAGAVPPEQPLGQLGDFRIVREVGRGGMGVVYEAEQVSLGRRVALKVLPFAATMDPRQLQRFHNEVRAAASLDHPHIVHVHAVGCERAVHFYAMQFIEGQTLAAVIADLRQRGGWPVSPDARPTTAHVPEAPAPAAPSADTAPRAAASTERTPLDRAHFRHVAELGIQAAEALDHAHTLGIVHRDVKPANLLVDERGGLWVTDFGLAHIQSDARLTMTGDLVGTLRYMSPEQALAKRVVVDHRTDVYSLGATLYELLTLEPAFPGTDRQELLRQIAFDEPKAPRRINKAIPPELETIVQKAMEKNPAERYATAKELADDLGRFLADEPIRARPAGVVRRLRKWGRRHPAAVAAAAAALTAIVVVLSGGIGWVANDRAMRTQRTTDEITTALKDSADWQQRRRVPEALSAARRAQAALAGGHANAELRRSVEARVFDLDLLAKLEEARLASAAIKDGDFDWELSDRRYGEIFHEFHLDVDGLSAEAAGKHIRDSSVALELAALLDDWAMLRRRLTPRDEARWKHLLDVARAADPDDWRNQVRDALAKKDWNALVTLASSDETAQLLPWTLSAVGRAFLGAKNLKPVEAILRKTQQRHPDDFWINFILAEVISKATERGKPIRAEETIPFQTVCVALRPQSAGAHNNLGAALLDKGDVEGAIAAYRKAMELDPKFVFARSNLAGALLDKGDVEGAIAACRKAIDLDPKLAKAHNNLGNALCEKKDLDGAIAEYRKAINLDPKLAKAHYGLCKALCDKGLLDEAIAECREAIDLDPKDAKAHNNLGVALAAKKDLDGAIAEFRKAIDIDTKYAWPHFNLGEVLRDKKDLDGAIAEFRKAIDLDPKHASAHNNLGGVLRDKKDLDGAIAEFRKAIDIDPKLALAQINLGGAFGDRGDVEEAIVAWRKAIELDPKDARAHNGLGSALRGKGDVEGAIAACRKAIDLDRKLAKAHFGLGAALRDKGLPDESIAECRKAIDLDPKDAVAHNGLGAALYDMQDLDGAIAEFRKAIDLDAKLALAHSSLAVALSAKGNVEGAIAECRRAIDLDPKDAAAHSNLGKILKDNTKDLDGAIAEFRKAIRLKQHYAEAHNNLGVALLDQGKLPEAVKSYRKAIALKSDYAAAHSNLALALKRQGKLPEAKAAFRQVVTIREKMLKQAPRRPDYHSQLGGILNDLAQLLIESGELAEARQLLDRAIRHQQNALKTDPENPTYRRFLRNHYTNLTGCFVELGEHAEGAKSAEQVPLFSSNGWEDYFGSARVLAHCILLAMKDPKLAPKERQALMQDYGDRSKKLVRGAIERSADNLQAQNTLARFLASGWPPQARDPAQAVALAKKLVERAPKAGVAWNTLGMAQYRAGDWKAAVAALETAMKHRNGGDSFDWFFLVMAHWQLGDKEPARQWYDKAVLWMDKNKPKDEDLRRSRAEAAAVLGVKVEPANAIDHAEYALACKIKHQYASAARFYRQAIAAKPDLVSSPGNGLRYNAARAAALAGNGAGKDGAKLTDTERAGFRKQALDWLRADLDAWRRLLVKEPGKAAPVVAQQMQHWQNDPDFNGMRGRDALGKLPKAERKDWQKLWADVANTLARAQAKTASEQRRGVK